MSRYVKVGYDRLKLNNREEIEVMYLDEGHSLSASQEMASVLFKALCAMITAEKRSWKNTRQNEIPFGLLEDKE